MLFKIQKPLLVASQTAEFVSNTQLSLRSVTQSFRHTQEHKILY